MPSEYELQLFVLGRHNQTYHNLERSKQPREIKKHMIAKIHYLKKK
jgi:hypothetical protein